MGVLQSTFRLKVLRAFFTNSQLALGSSASQELSGGDYAAQPASSANLVFEDDGTKATVYNNKKVYYPVASGNQGTASFLLIKNSVGGVSKIVWAQPLTDTISLTDHYRAKINKYVEGANPARGFKFAIQEVNS